MLMLSETRSSFPASLLLLPFLALSPLSCSSSSSDPAGHLTGPEVAVTSADSRVSSAGALSSSGGFYPLAVGDRWHYSRIYTLDYHGLGADTIRISTDRVNIGTESRSGRTYFVEEVTSVQDSRPGEVFRSWMRYRQDRSGLYYLDLCACEPPGLDPTGIRITSPIVASSTTPSEDILTTSSLFVAPDERVMANYELAELSARMERMRRALSPSSLATVGLATRPGGANSDEVALLRYPLHVGESWQVRPEIGLTYTVEGVDILETPAGRFPVYSIRISYPNDGPEDFARIWFGRAGRLGYRIHVVVTEGYPGTGWTGDETEIVDRLSVSR